MTFSIGWFSTGRGPGSRGLLELVQQRILQGCIPAQIDFVFSNRDPGEAEGSDLFFDLVRSYRIPLITHSSRQHKVSFKGDSNLQRPAYDRRNMDLLKGFHPDICVLAGYMLIVSPEMCHRYPMLNLHPALPNGPAGTWQDVIWSLIDTKASETGAMVHLAIEEVDRGPVVSYFAISLSGPGFDQDWANISGQSVQQLKETHGEDLPLFQRIRSEEYRREPFLLAETLRALALGSVTISDLKVLDAAGRPITSLRLDEAVEKQLMD